MHVSSMAYVGKGAGARVKRGFGRGVGCCFEVVNGGGFGAWLTTHESSISTLDNSLRQI